MDLMDVDELENDDGGFEGVIQEGEDDTFSHLLVLPTTGEPVKFFIHKTIKGDKRAGLIDDIEKYGGRLCKREENADTILVKSSFLDVMRMKYTSSRKTWVEGPDFIRICKSKGKYEHNPIQRYPMGGRKPVGEGVYRREFTMDDDVKLAKYLAERIPFKEKGGRNGAGVYKQLMDLCNLYGQHKWANRHTWQSWRERYKTRQEYFDELIDAYLEDHPPDPNGKGQYHLDREVNKKQLVDVDGKPVYRQPKRKQGYKPSAIMQAIRMTEEEEEEEEEESSSNDDEVEAINRKLSEDAKRRKSGREISLSIPPPPRSASLELGRGQLQKERSPSVIMIHENGDEEAFVFEDNVGLGQHLVDFVPADQQIMSKGKRVTPPTSPLPMEAPGPSGLPQNTQATLVNSPVLSPSVSSRLLSSPSRRAARKLVSSSGINAEQAETDTPPQYVPNPQSSPLLESTPSRRGLRLLPEVVIDSPPRKPASGPARNYHTRSRGVDDLHIAPSRARPRDTASPEPTRRLAEDAPYRNTRARSRSVSIEPRVLPPPKRIRGKAASMKPASKGRNSVTSTPVHAKGNRKGDMDIIQEGDEEMEENIPPSSPVSERLGSGHNLSREEQAVEGELLAQMEEAEESYHGIQGAVHVKEEEEEEEALDSDDEKTERSLLLNARNKLLDHLLKPRSPVSTPLARSSQGQQRVQPLVQPLPPPRTRAQRQTRKQIIVQSDSDGPGSETPSPNGFPSPVTKARAYKDRQDEERRRFPFRPAPGTRAAEVVAASQRVLRARG